MSDNLQIKRPLDASRINIHEPWEVNYWCKHFGVGQPQLVAAVHAVGTSKEKVKKYLGK